MRVPALAVLLVAALAPPALAQSGPAPYDDGTPSQSAPPQSAPPQSTPPRQHHHHGDKLRDKFNGANTTHDGRLTRDQAEAAGMHAIARKWDQIDTAHAGYITYDQLRAYRHAQHQASRQQQSAAGVQR